MAESDYVDVFRRHAEAYSCVIDGIIGGVTKGLSIVENTRVELLSRQEKIENLETLAKLLLMKRLAETGRLTIPGVEVDPSNMENGILQVDTMLPDLKLSIDGTFVELVTSKPSLLLMCD